MCICLSVIGYTSFILKSYFCRLLCKVLNSWDFSKWGLTPPSLFGVIQLSANQVRKLHLVVIFCYRYFLHGIC